VSTQDLPYLSPNAAYSGNPLSENNLDSGVKLTSAPSALIPVAITEANSDFSLSTGQPTYLNNENIPWPLAEESAKHTSNANASSFTPYYSEYERALSTQSLKREAGNTETELKRPSRFVEGSVGRRVDRGLIGSEYHIIPSEDRVFGAYQAFKNTQSTPIELHQSPVSGSTRLTGSKDSKSHLSGKSWATVLKPSSLWESMSSIFRSQVVPQMAASNLPTSTVESFHSKAAVVHSIDLSGQAAPSKAFTGQTRKSDSNQVSGSGKHLRKPAAAISSQQSNGQNLHSGGWENGISPEKAGDTQKQPHTSRFLKRVTSDINLSRARQHAMSPNLGMKHANKSFESLKPNSQSPTKKAYQKQRRLSKKVSDLESKLDRARRELSEVLAHAPSVPPIPGSLSTVSLPEILPNSSLASDLNNLFPRKRFSDIPVQPIYEALSPNTTANHSFVSEVPGHLDSPDFTIFTNEEELHEPSQRKIKPASSGIFPEDSIREKTGRNENIAAQKLPNSLEFSSAHPKRKFDASSIPQIDDFTGERPPDIYPEAQKPRHLDSNATSSNHVSQSPALLSRIPVSTTSHKDVEMLDAVNKDDDIVTNSNSYGRRTFKIASKPESEKQCHNRHSNAIFDSSTSRKPSQASPNSITNQERTDLAYKRPMCPRDVNETPSVKPQSSKFDAQKPCILPIPSIAGIVVDVIEEEPFEWPEDVF
jgi:hypothetical protein